MEQLIISDRAGVLKKYGKTEAEVETDVEILVEWAKKQPHLPPIQRYKIELLLPHCKYRIEKAKRVLDMYYSVRNVVPELFENWDPLSPEIQQQLKLTGFFLLPQLTPELARVYVTILIDDNPDEYNAWEFWKLFFISIEMAASIEYNASEILLFDLARVKFSHLIKHSPIILKKVYVTALEAYSAKLSGIHVINAHSSVSNIMSIAKIVMKPKLYERIHIHDNIESLQEFIPKHMLPKDYGGDGPSCLESCGNWIKQMEKSRDYLINEVKSKAIESKRLDDTNEEIFGSIHGTFKKLTVD